MASRISTILKKVLVLSAPLIALSNPVLAASSGNVPERQLKEYLRKYKYPYSEIPLAEREQLVRYAIKTLNEQMAHFQPGQGITISYFENALAHMQKLLSTLLPQDLI